MIFYNLIRNYLFKLNPDIAHKVTLKTLQKTPLMVLLAFNKSPLHDPYQFMGLEFKNKVGLAAGFDKNGLAIDALFALGFGFIELGGITPEPQKGNPYPHVLRLEKFESLINHCGLNNLGVDFLKQQLVKRKYKGVVGVNIAANKTTASEIAYKDYAICFEKLYEHADYFAANISCPNIKGKDAAQQFQQSVNIAEHLCELRESKFKTVKPLFIKLSPDTEKTALAEFFDSCKHLPINGFICGNTTVKYPDCLTDQEKAFGGGLSGNLITTQAKNQMQNVSELKKEDQIIIGTGGIHNAATAQQAKINGASLIQIYTSMVYQGPSIIHQLAKAIAGY